MNTEFVYKLPGTARSSRPGAHRSKSRGSGMSFAAHARLFDQPDPRRLDLRASLQDLQGDWLVRTYLQRSSISVKAIVDVSAAMRFGNPGKLQVAADFLMALGNSAYGYGDSTSLLAFDQQFREDLFVPPSRSRAAGSAMAESILHSSLSRQRAEVMDGLGNTVERVAGTTGLVFIVSDFHWPLERLPAILDKISTAMIVPLVVWDKSEVIPPAAGQWLAARDISRGKTRHLWLRQSTREQWLENVRLRRDEINATFERHDSKALYLDGSFNADSLTQYFMENVA